MPEQTLGWLLTIVNPATKTGKKFLIYDAKSAKDAIDYINTGREFMGQEVVFQATFETHVPQPKLPNTEAEKPNTPPASK